MAAAAAAPKAYIDSCSRNAFTRPAHHWFLPASSRLGSRFLWVLVHGAGLPQLWNNFCFKADSALCTDSHLL